ncbi:GntR family transcriptional regulator [Candidatus Darwinibacter acetoxidans]
MKFTTSIPIYLQIMDEIKRQIATGVLKPGDKLPSQRELAAQLKVNANTVQRAYREMEVLGLVETLRGQGTFVRRSQAIVEETRRGLLSRLVDDFACAMRSLGFGRGEALELVRSAFERIEAGEGVEEQ